MKNVEEKKMISEHPERRPYASKIDFILEVGTEYKFEGEACLLLKAPYVVRIKPKQNEQLGHHQCLTATIEGFSSAGEAENMGLKLTQSILWSVISRKFHLRLLYHTPQPSIVFDRTLTKNNGIRLSSHTSATLIASTTYIVDLIEQALTNIDEIDPRLLISMELFTSAKLESTERTRFIGLVSSLEPLIIQEPYNDPGLDKLVRDFIEALDKTPLSVSHKASVSGRVNELKKESISHSVKRYVNSYFPDKPEIAETVLEAYNIRSKLLHEGSFDADIDEKAEKLEDIIRLIYGKILNLDLMTPAKI